MTNPLQAYAAFLRRDHLAEVARTNLAINQELDVPLLRLFAHLPAEQLQAMTEASMAEFLADLEAGTALQKAAQSLAAWERDELPGVPREAIEIADLVLVYAAQRRTLLRFIPRFVQDLSDGLAIVEAMDTYFVEVQGNALQLYERLRREAAEETVAQAEELAAQSEELEAQRDQLRSAHEEAARQGRLLAQVLDNVPGAVGYCSWDLVIQAANQPYLAMVGKPAADVLGKHVSEVFPPESQAALEQLKAQLATGEPFRQNGVPAAPDDPATRYFDHTVAAVTAPDGTPVGILSLSVDVTERVALERELAGQSREVEQQKRVLERVTDSAPAGIAFLDRELTVRWANPELLRLFQRDAASFLGRAFLEKAQPETRAHFESLLRRVLQTGEAYHAKAAPYTIAGRETFWDFSYVPVPGDDGRPDGVLVFALEVTPRVDNDRLHVERLAQLEQVDRMKDEFLAALSSQLATPINTVIGFASVLDEGVLGGALRPEQQEYVRRILATCRVQLTLVNDLLDLGRMSGGRLQLMPEPTDLAGLARGVLQGLEPLTQQQGQRVITYLPPGQPKVQVDGPRVEQVLTNVLHAACKLTPPGGQIRVETTAHPDHVRFEVQDTAEALSTDQAAQALAGFALYGGTWLGLSVPKRLIEAQGGQMGVDPRPGLGNTFWFTVPLAR